MIKSLLTLVFLNLSIWAYEFSSHHNMSAGAIQILDVKVLDFDEVEDIDFKGISDLAYSKKQGLYALSDFGNLFKLELKINNKKIGSVKLLEAYVLRGKKGKVLKKKKSDAEGMIMTPKGLLISFERDPKISLYDFTGNKIKNLALNEELIDINNYQKKNRALEALVLHPKFGIITSPEVPLKNEDKNYHSLYSLYKKWRFKASYKITSMQLLKDNNLLVLERNFSYLKGYTIRLSKVYLNNCKDICKSKELATLKSSDGWNLDNFEGLTYLGENLYLMVSDDNGSLFQKTLLVLFEIKNI